MRIGAIVITVVGCVPRSAPPADHRLHLAPCRVDHVAESLWCGMLDVPEDRDIRIAGGSRFR